MEYAVQGFRQQQTVTLVLEAADAADARRQAESQGCSVFEIKARRAAWRGASAGAAFPLLQFNQSLLILLRAGLSVVEAIETLADRETRGDARAVIGRLRQDLGEGLPLSTALQRQERIFPALYIAGVRANERTGTLIEAIERFILYRAQSEALRKRVVGAAIYPALILAVGSAVILFLLLYVVPRFSQVFADLGDHLPLMSRLLLDWGRFVQGHGTTLLAGAFVAVVATGFVLRLAAVRRALEAALLAVPRIGDAVRIFQLARFYRALGLLQQAGIPILAALDMVIGLLPLGLRPALAAARRDIADGRAVSDAFERHGLTTAVSLRLLRVAERTGQLGEMLERSAVFHEEDIAQAIDWFVRLFEPLLMIVIGIVIGGVVLLMYAPIFELAGSIQ